MALVRPLTWLLVLLAFGAVGQFSGWLIGSSNSPVVATVLPLLFGLIGGFSFRFLDRRAAEDSYVTALKKLTDDAETRKRISSALGLEKRPSWLPAFWAIAVLVFCGTAFLGVVKGIDNRLGCQQNLTVVLEAAGVDSASVQGEKRLAVQNALFRLRAMATSEEEIADIFEHGIAPLLEESTDSDDYDLAITLSQLFQGLESGQRGRGPASFDGSRSR